MTTASVDPADRVGKYLNDQTTFSDSKTVLNVLTTTTKIVEVKPA